MGKMAFHHDNTVVIVVIIVTDKSKTTGFKGKQIDKVIKIIESQ